MNCERCGDYHLERVADMGMAFLVRCATCGHQQLTRPQAPRGVRVRGADTERGVSFAGEVSA